MITGCFLFQAGGISAQEILDMERALDIAIQNSPEMQQVELALVRSRKT